MNIKKIIYNLFFKKKKKSTKNKSTQKSGSTTTRVKTKGQPEVVLKNGKYDTTLLRQQVSETEYISNLRIGRSWILPQLVEMGFKKKGLSRKFDIDFFESNILKNYDLSQAGRNEIWTLLKRNYKAVAVTDGESPRAKWWTKELLIEMMYWDFFMVGKRSWGVDRDGCKDVLVSIEEMTDFHQIYEAVVKYDRSRMRTRAVDSYRFPGHAKPLPKVFVDAYMGDGAYNAMMTMVKVLGIRIKEDNGRILSRDECICEIEEKASMMNGHGLLEYCKETFFDTGVFDYKKFIK